MSSHVRMILRALPRAPIASCLALAFGFTLTPAGAGEPREPLHPLDYRQALVFGSQANQDAHIRGASPSD